MVQKIAIQYLRLTKHTEISKMFYYEVALFSFFFFFKKKSKKNPQIKKF